MKIEEVRSKTDSELEFDMANIKKEMFDLRIKAAVGSVANPAAIRVHRRAIARIHTVLHERAMGVRGQEAR
ncbi:MAG: large subunit ribosomal protein L29 [Chlamydiales bacterium]|jgi:large subunit ribosomal protein L29